MVWTGLKITRQLYCRLSFHLGLSDGSLWLDSGYTFLARSLTGVGFPCGSASKESAFNAGDLASIPGLGRSPGEGKGHPLQCSGLENPMDCIAHVGRKEPDTTERVSLPLFSHVGVCVCSLCSASGWTVPGSTTVPTIFTWSLDSSLLRCSLSSLGSGTISQTSSLSSSFLLCHFEGRDFESAQISHSSSNFLFIHWLIYIYINLWFPVCEFLSIALSIYF